MPRKHYCPHSPFRFNRGGLAFIHGASARPAGLAPEGKRTSPPGKPARPKGLVLRPPQAIPQKGTRVNNCGSKARV